MLYFFKVWLDVSGVIKFHFICGSLGETCGRAYKSGARGFVKTSDFGQSSSHQG